MWQGTFLSYKKTPSISDSSSTTPDWLLYDKPDSMFYVSYLIRLILKSWFLSRALSRRDKMWRRSWLNSLFLYRVPRCCMWLRRNYLIWPVLLLLLVGAVLTALLPPAEDQGGRSVLGVLRRETSHEEDPALGHRSDRTEEQRFTIIIQTYNRTDILLRLLNHYQAVPHLWKIIIVWNNVGEQTPLKLWNSLGPHPVPVVFKEQTSNQMRNRLQPFPEIDTDGQFIWVFIF